MELEPDGNYSKIAAITLKPGVNIVLLKKGSFRNDSGIVRCEATILASDIERLDMSIKDRLS